MKATPYPPAANPEGSVLTDLILNSQVTSPELLLKAGVHGAEAAVLVSMYAKI
jgi:hypothetical protein